MNSIDVVCLKHGNTAYDWSWVDKLYKGVTSNFSMPIEFHVMTDKPDPSVPYNQIQLPDLKFFTGWEKGRAAWWYKVYMFSPYHPIQRKFVYFDLDVIFTGNCDFLWDTPDDMIGIRHEFLFDYIPGKENNKVHNTSILVFDPSKHPNHWDDFRSRPNYYRRRFQGDQDFISLKNPRSKIFGLDRNKVVSWRYDVLKGGIDTIIPVPTPEGEKKTKQTKHKMYAHMIYKQPKVTHVLPEDARVVVFNGFHFKQNKITGVDFIDTNWRNI